MYVCVSMDLHVYAYVEICNGYVKCSDKNLAELSSSGLSPRLGTLASILCQASPPYKAIWLI